MADYVTVGDVLEGLKETISELEQLDATMPVAVAIDGILVTTRYYTCTKYCHFEISAPSDEEIQEMRDEGTIPTADITLVIE